MTFKTTSIQLASYLIAAEKLALITSVKNQAGMVEFFFDDPKRKGGYDEFDFNRGAAVSAMALFTAHRLVRQLLKKAAEKAAYVSGLTATHTD